VNNSQCAQLDANNTQKYGTDQSKWPVSCGSNLNLSKQYGYNSTCACFAGKSGYNCGNGGTFLGVVGVLAGGIIAAIVVAAIIAGCMVSGGAYAVSTQVGSDQDQKVTDNPLYKQPGHGAQGLAG